MKSTSDSENEWELSKENVQPLKQGRQVSNLNTVLHTHSGDVHARLKEERNTFEKELRTYDGDDPLDVWDRYIRWTEENFPSGGKESHLDDLLGRCVVQFDSHTAYDNDQRLVIIWLKFSRTVSNSLEIYSLMYSKGIGKQLALFYEAWAGLLENSGNTKKADATYLLGIENGAQPIEMLKQSHSEFQSRAARQAMAAAQPVSGPSYLATDLSRTALGSLKKQGSRGTVAVDRARSTRPATGLSVGLKAAATNNSGANQIHVFCDENTAPGAGLPAEGAAEGWVVAPEHKMNRENYQQPGKWTKARVKQKNVPVVDVKDISSVVKPSFSVHEDHDSQQSLVTPRKGMDFNPVLSAKKPDKEQNSALLRLQAPTQPAPPGVFIEVPMYCKDKVYMGTQEFSLEELRAHKWLKKRKKQQDQEVMEALVIAMREGQERAQQQQEEVMRERKLMEEERKQWHLEMSSLMKQKERLVAAKAMCDRSTEQVTRNLTFSNSSCENASRENIPFETSSQGSGQWSGDRPSLAGSSRKAVTPRETVTPGGATPAQEPMRRVPVFNITMDASLALTASSASSANTSHRRGIAAPSPTVNTKEALNVVMDMFNSTLAVNDQLGWNKREDADREQEEENMEGDDQDAKEPSSAPKKQCLFKIFEEPTEQKPPVAGRNWLPSTLKERCASAPEESGRMTSDPAHCSMFISDGPPAPSKAATKGSVFVFEDPPAAKGSVCVFEDPPAPSTAATKGSLFVFEDPPAAKGSVCVFEDPPAPSKAATKGSVFVFEDPPAAKRSVSVFEGPPAPFKHSASGRSLPAEAPTPARLEGADPVTQADAPARSLPSEAGQSSARPDGDQENVSLRRPKSARKVKQPLPSLSDMDMGEETVVSQPKGPWDMLDFNATDMTFAPGFSSTVNFTAAARLASTPFGSHGDMGAVPEPSVSRILQPEAQGKEEPVAMETYASSSSAVESQMSGRATRASSMFTGREDEQHGLSPITEQSDEDVKSMASSLSSTEFTRSNLTSGTLLGASHHLTHANASLMSAHPGQEQGQPCPGPGVPASSLKPIMELSSRNEDTASGSMCSVAGERSTASSGATPPTLTASIRSTTSSNAEADSTTGPITMTTGPITLTTGPIATPGSASLHNRSTAGGGSGSGGASTTEDLANMTCHAIDTTNYVAPPVDERTEHFLNMSVAIDPSDPFDSDLIEIFLSRLPQPLSSYPNYHIESVTKMPPIGVNKTVTLGPHSYKVLDKLGEGGFASVFHVERVDRKDTDNGQAKVLKVETPARPWEFYIAMELERRLGDLQSPWDARPCFMVVDEAYFFSNGSCLLNSMHNYGSLLDMINLHRSGSLGMPEAFIMILTCELLHIVEALHSCNIIHGDLKPDNFLVCRLPSAGVEPAQHLAGRYLKLIDFGRSIDMKMFPRGTSFTVKVKTSGFQCIEMKTGQPWTYQTDLFGLVGTWHVLAHSKYMDVYQRHGRWRVNSSYKRIWNASHVWRRMFDECLNIPSCDELPDLASYRQELEALYKANTQQAMIDNHLMALEAAYSRR